MNYRILSLEDANTWNDLLSTLPSDRQDIYFKPEYYHLYQEYGDGLAECFVYEKDGGVALYPYLKNKINDLGYKLDGDYFDIQGAYGYNGLVTSNEDKAFLAGFFNIFSDYCKENHIVAEFTRFHPLVRNHTYAEAFMTVVFDRKTMFVDLGRDYNEIFRKFQTTTKKQIKRAENRHGIEVKKSFNDLNAVDSFFEIYHEAMDRVKSTPYLYFNKRYFSSLIENTQNVCLTAIFEGQPIASVIAFYNDFYIHGHLGGALTAHLDKSPTSLLYAEMIQFGIKNGCSLFHAGGGTTSSPDDPLLKYKLNFSDQTADFFIGKKVHNLEVYKMITECWTNKNPDKSVRYKNFILKYRY